MVTSVRSLSTRILEVYHAFSTVFCASLSVIICRLSIPFICAQSCITSASTIGEQLRQSAPVNIKCDSPPLSSYSLSPSISRCSIHNPGSSEQALIFSVSFIWLSTCVRCCLLRVARLGSGVGWSVEHGGLQAESPGLKGPPRTITAAFLPVFCCLAAANRCIHSVLSSVAWGRSSASNSGTRLTTHCTQPKLPPAQAACNKLRLVASRAVARRLGCWCWAHWMSSDRLPAAAAENISL